MSFNTTNYIGQNKVIPEKKDKHGVIYLDEKRFPITGPRDLCAMNLHVGEIQTKLIMDDNDHRNGSIVSFNSINYRLQPTICCDLIPMKKKSRQILFDLTGVFKSGMNAILGPTRCGKSSLLDILADRKDHRGLEGKVFLDGQPQTPDFKYRVGYVVQDNIVCGNLSVRENLIFSANLRLPRNISSKDKHTIVDEVIEQLGLEKCADSKVGNEFQRGISGGERKRTNIGMELVLSPKVLFLDEPTTGLDSSTARNVMEHLHQLSRKDRTIIFSIHQPRYSIFKLFDTLFLLAGGRCIYHGSSNEVLPYFQSNGFRCEEHDNPADFLLDVCQGDYQSDANQKAGQLVEYLNEEYEKSSIYSTVKEEANRLNDPLDQSSSVKQGIGKKSRLSEIFYVAQRTMRNAFRNPALIGMQIGISIFLGVLGGLIYSNTDDSMDIGLKNRSGAIFFITANQVFGSLSSIDLFIKERPLFQHENVSGYYHVSTYFMAKLLCHIIPLRLLPSVLFSLICYFMIGFQRILVKFLIFLVGIYSTAICASSFCFFISSSVRIFGIANLIAAMFCVLTLIFSGLLVDVTSVVPFLSWIKWISIFRYSNNIFAINEFVGLTLYSRNHTIGINGIEILKKQNIEYVDQWDLWKNFVALAGISLSFLLLTYIQLRRMKKTK